MVCCDLSSLLGSSLLGGNSSGGAKLFGGVDIRHTGCEAGCLVPSNLFLGDGPCESYDKS